MPKPKLCNPSDCKFKSPSVARLWFVLPCQLGTALAPNIFSPWPSLTEAQALSPRDDPSLLVSCKPLKVHVSIRYSMSSGTRDWGQISSNFWMFCSCKFIIFGRSTAKVDHCNSPSCILKRNIAHRPSCVHLLHLCQNCLGTLQICILPWKSDRETFAQRSCQYIEFSTYSPCLTLLLNAMG